MENTTSTESPKPKKSGLSKLITLLICLAIVVFGGRYVAGLFEQAHVVPNPLTLTKADSAHIRIVDSARVKPMLVDSTKKDSVKVK